MKDDTTDALAKHLEGRHSQKFRSDGDCEKSWTRREYRRTVLGLVALLLIRATHVAYQNADHTTKQLAHLYYQAPAIVLASFWLWGFNLWIWRLFKFDPHPLVVWNLTGENMKSHLNHTQVWRIAAYGTVAYLLSLTSFLRFANAAAFAVDENAAHFKAHLCAAGIYILPLLVLVLPTHGVYPYTRRFIRSTITRCLTAWNQPVTFGDFFLADVLCSKAKSISDAERSVCAIVVGPEVMFSSSRDPRFGTCGSTSWAVPFLLSLPSLVRFTQCVRQVRDGGFLMGSDLTAKSNFEKKAAIKTATQNAAKYLSVFPVIFLSHLKYSVDSEVWTSYIRPLWIISAVFNTGFSFFWDVTHDWDLRLFSQIGNSFTDSADGKQVPNDASKKYLRARLLYGTPILYYAAISVNFLLRLSWTYKLSSHLRHNAGLVLVFTLLEISRRFLWSLGRVEKAYLAREGTGKDLPR